MRIRASWLPFRAPLQAVHRGLAGGLLALSLITAPSLVHAASPADAGTDRAVVLAQSGGVSLDQAVAQVQRRTGGRILSAETRMSDGAPVHHIRVLTGNQRVRTIRVDGRTGEWL